MTERQGWLVGDAYIISGLSNFYFTCRDKFLAIARQTRRIHLLRTVKCQQRQVIPLIQ